MDKPMILVPLDHSKLSEGAVPYAAEVARLTGAGLRFLMAVAPADDFAQSTVEARIALERFWCEHAQAYLDTVTAATRADGLEAEGVAVVGSVVECILSASEETDVRMIVMSTHGEGGFKRMLVGSVADKVMRMAERPTLLIRGEEAGGPRPQVSFKRIMVPLDGSTEAEVALGPAVELARASGATLVLVCAQRSIYQTLAGYSALPNWSEVEDQIDASLDTYLQSARRRIPAGIAVETVAKRETPAVALEEEVQHNHLDLVVMTTHGRGGLRRAVLGSMADRMVRLGAPTLLIRPQATDIAEYAEEAAAGATP